MDTDPSDRRTGIGVPRLGYGDALEPAEVFGADPQESVRWGLGMTGKCLRFGARFWPGAVAVDGARGGRFFEGLWGGDVVELFLCDSGGQAYVEFNLAPNGSWWVCGFSGIRQRSPGFQIPPVSAHQGDVVELWIDVRGLPFSMAGAKANVTGIYNGGYFSAATLGGEQPDFHRPEDFVELLIS